MSSVFEEYNKCTQLNILFWLIFEKIWKNNFFFRFGVQKVPSMMDQQKICSEAINLAH